jgi:hypothetical protein
LGYVLGVSCLVFMLVYQVRIELSVKAEKGLLVLVWQLFYLYRMLAASFEHDGSLFMHVADSHCCGFCWELDRFFE